MFRSIRSTLQVWYGTLFALAFVALVVAMDVRLRSTELRRIDAEIEGAAQTLLSGPDGNSSRVQEWWDHTVPITLRRLQIGASSPYYIVWNQSLGVMQASQAGANVPADEASSVAIAAAVAHPGVAKFISHPGIREAVVAEGPPSNARVLVGRPIGAELRALDQFRLQTALTAVLILVVALAGGGYVIGRAMRPIDEISRTARKISGSDMSGRIAPGKMKAEIALLATTLNDAFARVQAAFERQIQFTADASHELRTPVAVINSHTEVSLDQARSPGEYRATIAACHRAGKRMASLVDSLLTLARVDAKQLYVEPETFDLGDCVAECVEFVRGLADQRRIAIEELIEPVDVHTDRTLLASVITNLLSNAIRYNRDGGSVTVSLRRDGGLVAIGVADTGVGIAPEHAARIFERFFRADKARSAAAGGVGLGLAICWSVVHYLGGTISFTSEVGVGTRFEVRIPMARAGGAEPELAESVNVPVR